MNLLHVLACVVISAILLHIVCSSHGAIPLQVIPIPLHQRNPSDDVIYFNHSVIDSYPPCIDRFPTFKHARSFRMVLTHGDSLFIPSGWWHWVFSDEHCIAISHVVHSHESEVVRMKQTGVTFKEPVVYSPTRAIDFKKHIAESVPFVFKDPRLRAISNDVLARELTGVHLLLSKTSTCNPVDKSDHPTMQIVNATYHDFVQLRHSDYNAYIGMSPLSKRDFTPYLNRDWAAYVARTGRPNHVYLWQSHKPTETGLHYDITDNMLTVHSGRKTVLLFPPSETNYLYNAPLTNSRHAGYLRRLGEQKSPKGDKRPNVHCTESPFGKLRLA